MLQPELKCKFGSPDINIESADLHLQETKLNKQFLRRMRLSSQTIKSQLPPWGWTNEWLFREIYSDFAMQKLLRETATEKSL